MKIRLAALQDSDRVLKILNEVTLDMLNKRINQWSYPWNPEIIENEIKKTIPTF